MKHDFKVTLFLIGLFFSAQIVGLFLLNQSILTIEKEDSGKIEVTYSEPITGRPELEGQDSFIYILIMILVGTALLMLLIKFRLFRIWKAWFFLAIWGALSISFSVLLDDTASIILALALTILKIFRPNVYIHNLTEVFIYGGIAILISPMFNVLWGIMLLIAISIYDAIAVWKLKHMITLATAQADQKMFAGLLIPYKIDKAETQIRESEKKTDRPKSHKDAKTIIKTDIPPGIRHEDVKSAILGGGDIAFPMLFAGSVMTWLIEQGISKGTAFFQSLVISAFAGVALYLLLVKSEKDKFYPAMPFISAGCFAGYAVIRLILLF